MAARYAIVQAPQFTEQVAALSDAQLRELAGLFQILMVAPLPGESVLSVTPDPYIPGVYIVPFAGGLVSYIVQPGRRVIGMLDIIGVEPE